MLVVAGLSLKHIEPRVWDEASPYHLPGLRAIMVSYAEFHQMAAARRRAMEQGLHGALGVPRRVKIFLDNGSFYFSRLGERVPAAEYEEFVIHARPDWRPVPQDFIPAPQMSRRQQLSCMRRTMTINRDFEHDGYVPVIHISGVLPDYIAELKAHERLREKPALALGGIVPNLLRAPKALSYRQVLDSLRIVRRDFTGKSIHVFGIGGTATLHIAALMNMDSVDSSGWRNRAARGIIQLPGSGERIAAQLGSWRGRQVGTAERELLARCLCPACRREGIAGLRATGSHGFRNRAAHNLWTLLNEEKWVRQQLRAGTYADNFERHLDNTIYRPLISHLVERRSKN